MCFHRGYYSTENTEVMTTYLTAQFFASFGKKRISRKKWNARTDFYEGKQMLPELLHDLTLDLQVNWDDHYSATRFPPSRMYKNAKIDTESNRVIHRIDFDRLRQSVTSLTCSRNYIQNCRWRLFGSSRRVHVGMVFNGGIKI